MSLYSQAVLLDSPDGYWRLGEASGNAADSSPNNRPMVWGASVTHGLTGALTQDADKAASFPGGGTNTAARLSLATTTEFDYTGTLPFSIECWINVTALDATTRRLCDHNPGTGGGAGYLWWVNSTTLSFVREVGGVDKIASVSWTGLTGAWHHVVGTYDSANVRLYRNAVLVGGPTADVQTQPSLGAGELTIGNAVSGTRTFNGGLDEFAIYPSALSPARILAHYNAGKALRLPNPASRTPRSRIVIPAGAVYA